MGQAIRYRQRRQAYVRTRPLWRTAIDALVFLAVLTLVLAVLNHFNVLDVRSGGYRAIDGDSLRRGDVDIRLHGIDAVELNQTCTGADEVEYPCGRMALDSLRALMRGHVISCSVVDRDRYGRAVALCGDGNFDLNRAQVRAGWAVAYRRHSLAYTVDERRAREERRGIWAGRFELPEQYRAHHARSEAASMGEPAED